MTKLRLFALMVVVVAIICRFAARQIPFDLGVVVTPQLHRGIPLGVVFFWLFLALRAALTGISFLRHSRGIFRFSQAVDGHGSTASFLIVLG